MARRVKFDGELLRKCREKNDDKSQEQLADDARIDPKTVYRAEKGHNISWDYAEQIIGALGITTDQRAKLIVWDSADSQEADKESKRSKEHVKDRFFDRIIDLPKIQTSKDSRFLYNSNRLEFIDRESEVSELREFCDRSEPFLWWSLVGPGGIGKSRLAFEFCRNLEEKGLWKAGFLYQTDDQEMTKYKEIKESLLQWETWNPVKPTLIVVDHVFARAAFMGKLVHVLAKRAENPPLLNPVRLLLIERDAEGMWKEGFSKKQDRVVRSFQDMSRHSDQPLNLQTLENDALFAIIRKMSGDETKSIPDLLEQLSSIDSQRRPLFAALIGDAIKRTGSTRRWDQDSLLTDFLEHEQKEYWAPAGITDADRLWLCLATLTGGAFASWLEDPKLTSALRLPTIDDRSLVYRYYEMTGQRHQPNVGVPQFGPLRPDILGEFFVLKYLTDTNNLMWLKELSACLNAAWEKRPAYVAEFLVRLESDFIDCGETSGIFECLPFFYAAPADKSNNVQMNWGTLMLQRARFFSFQHRDPARAVDLCDQTLDHFDITSNFIFDFLVTSALLTKMESLSVLSRHEEVMAVFDLFLARSNASSEPYIWKTEKVGSALLLKGIALGHTGQMEEAVVTFGAVVANFDLSTQAISDDVRAECDVSFELRVRPLVVLAILQKTFYLLKLDRPEEAKAAIASNEFALANMPDGEDAERVKAIMADIESLLK